MRKYYRRTVVPAISVFLVISFSISNADPGDKKPDDGNRHSVKAKKNPATEINWVRYDEGLELAKKENKKLLVEFTAKWCGFCKRMRTTTFRDPDIVALLDDYYVTSSIDGESRDTINIEGWITSERNLAKEYRIRGYPTYWFLTPGGEKIAPVRGYRSKDELYNILDYLKDDLYKTKKFEDFLKEKRKKK
jgi:thioredoxin-related protein